jgi:hypothetical protein
MRNFGQKPNICETTAYPVNTDVRTHMNTDESAKLLVLLEEIRANQKLQLEHQLEALELQRRQFTVFQEQAARAERIQQKAELLQDRGATLVRAARKAVFVMVPIIVLLLVYLSWLIFRSRF